MGEVQEEKGMAPVGTYRLAYTQMGLGSPVVVLESPYGVARSTWDKVMPEIAKFTRVINYDRGSLGESERAGRRRTLSEVVRDLESMLNTLEVPGPYILVGSSIGGHIIRYFAYQHPDQIAGLVMIDFTHPDSAARTLAVIPPLALDDSDFLKEMRYNLTHVEVHADDPEHDLEGFDFKACDDQAREASSLGDLLLVVIAAANHAKDEGDPVNDPTLVPPSLAAAFEQAHLETQADLTRLSTRGRLVIAWESGHLVQEYEPELVIGVIQEMVKAYRTEER